MQAFKAFWKLALNKLPSSIIYFVIFLVIIILLSNVSAKDTASKFEVTTADICIIDKDRSSASSSLTEYLSSIHNLVTLQDYSRESLQDNLYYQTISYVLEIPEGFEETLLVAGNKPALTSSKRKDSATGYFIDRQIDSYVNELMLYLASGLSIEEAGNTLNQTILDTPQVTSIQFDNNKVSGSKMMYYFFQYLPYVFIMMLLEGLSPTLISFHRKEVCARISCSSMPPHIHNASLAIGVGLYSIIIWLLFMLVGMIMYGPGQLFSHNGLLCMANSFLFLLVTVAITLLIGVFSLRNEALNMVANIFGLGMSFLCGIFVPQYYLSDTVLSIARFLPAYWYVRITNMLSGISNEAISMKEYWSCMGIQALFFVAILTVYLTLSQKIRTHK